MLDDKYLLELYTFQHRPEPLTTETPKTFDLIKLSNSEIWDKVVYIMQHYLRGRYVNHYIEEKFIIEKTLKRVQTGTVEYWLHIEYLLQHQRK